MTDPFGDVVHSAHREFLEEYLKSWPNPLQTHFEKGRLIRAEFEGEMQKCEVLEVDCSLIYVIFEVSTFYDTNFTNQFSSIYPLYGNFFVLPLM